MKTYTKNELLKIAKRHNNTKRSYLLVNPLQSKHVPVSPVESLEMMNCLAYKLKEKYPTTGLVIGFAETATAIASHVASHFSSDCIYIQTTREDVKEGETWVEFLEEHSHAMNQKICGDGLEYCIEKSKEIIFVDDELSTGKTLINIINNLRLKYPKLNEKKIIAASIINRLSEANLNNMISNNIFCESVLFLPEENYEDIVKNFETKAPIVLDTSALCDEMKEYRINAAINPRIKCNIVEYVKECKGYIEEMYRYLETFLDTKKKVLVLGTEEYMYPAILLGSVIQKANECVTVKCHATTRSPIGISEQEEYPLTNGYQLPSFYDPERTTFLYDMEHYDVAIILTDSCIDSYAAKREVSKLLHLYGCDEIIFGEVAYV